MKKVELARKRNFFKYLVVGLHKPVDSSILSEDELIEWNKIMSARGRILDNFDDNSKEFGLNVNTIPKCWCGKRRKTKCDDEYCQENL